MINCTKRELQVLDGTLASNLLQFNNFWGQRILQPTHVQRLEKEIENDNFLDANIKMAMYDGSIYLVNGQHTCHAVINTKKQVDITYAEYKCDSEIELSDLFIKIGQDKKRTLKDRVRMEMGVLKNSANLDVVTLIASTNNIRNYKKGATDEDKILPLRGQLDFIEFVNNLFYPEVTRYWKQQVQHMFKVAVMHAIMLTWDKDQEVAVNFWNAIRDGENLTKRDPQYKLREYLKNTVTSRNTSNKTGANNIEITTKCIHAWNAFRAKKPTTLRYVRGKGLPKVK
ncbi:MAG: hypothetical protein DRI57_00240 [Deltaproteobacteria bacterium]|nr:MAG: hypothetical protein DRI57_00240 [Deltaproteobacteria bacterium]